MNNKYFVVVDVETSGLDSEKSEIIQLSAIAINPKNLEIIPDYFDQYIKPQRPEHWSKEAESIHGITLKSLDNALHPQVVFKDFSLFLNKFNYSGTIWNNPILIGQNIQFDLNFINVYCKKYGYWDKSKNKNKLFNMMPQYLDLKDLTFYWLHDPGLVPNLKLDSLMDYMGMEKRKKHSSLEDCKVTAKLFVKFLGLHRRLAQKIQFKDAMK